MIDSIEYIARSRRSKIRSQHRLARGGPWPRVIREAPMRGCCWPTLRKPGTLKAARGQLAANFRLDSRRFLPGAQQFLRETRLIARQTQRGWSLAAEQPWERRSVASSEGREGLPKALRPGPARAPVRNY